MWRSSLALPDVNSPSLPHPPTPVLPSPPLPAQPTSRHCHNQEMLTLDSPRSLPLPPKRTLTSFILCSSEGSFTDPVFLILTVYLIINLLAIKSVLTFIICLFSNHVISIRVPYYIFLYYCSTHLYYCSTQREMQCTRNNFS